MRIVGGSRIVVMEWRDGIVCEWCVKVFFFFFRLFCFDGWMNLGIIVIFWFLLIFYLVGFVGLWCFCFYVFFCVLF